MTKKGKVLATSISLGVLTVLSAGLIVGTSIAYNYESLLDVFFSKSDYSATSAAKKLCEDVVAEGIVLLKNEDNALPLNDKENKVALFGQNSVDFVYGGSGSGAIDTSTALNLKQAFEEANFKVNNKLWDFYKSGPGSSYRKKTPDTAGHGSFAVNEVPQSAYTEDVIKSLDDDVGIVVIGRSGGESADLPVNALPTGSLYLQIDANEKAMLELACSKYEKVVVILNTNNPMELGFLNDSKYANVKAAIWVGGVGQEGIRAIPKVLNGTYNPSGRLVDTYAYDSTSAPSFANMASASFTNSSVKNGTNYIVFGEGIYVGYRYYETRYEDVVLGNTTGFNYVEEVQFPFGYGQSYTTFEWSNFQVDNNADGKSFDLSVTVKNTGEVAGKDVVEFYLQKPYTAGGVETSAVELIEFAKTKVLEPNTEETVKVNVLKEDLTSYDYKTNKTYVLNAGDFYFSAGKNAHDGLNNILALKGKNTSHGMDYDGNSALAKLAFNNPAIDATTYSVSSVTNKPITNALDDADVNHYESFNYLSRNDWNGTFPTLFKDGRWEAPSQLLADLEFFDINNDTSDDEAIDAFTFISGSTATSYKVSDLINADYDDPKWDDLVSQLSYTQMTKLIRIGGYATQQLDKIGLPATTDKDGPSGISGSLVGGVSCMAWPAEVVMASTWNKEMIEKLGVLFGEDSITANVAGVYGPGANIHRSPYSGRNFEYFSEDPILSYKIAAHEIKGLRSKGVITYVKHFALNDQETNRYGAAIFANEQAIREIFTRGFKGAIVEGKSNALMVAMNRVGARWCGANKGMMNTLLREEWGFEGFSITDQASVPAMFYQDMISGLWAGTDMWLNTNSSYWSLSEYKNDKNVQYYVHQATKRIVYGITKSWAVNDSYKTSDGGEQIESKVSVLPWRAILWTVDCLVWTGTIALGTIFVINLIKNKKAKSEA